MNPQALLDFALTLDQLKSVERRSRIAGGERHENSAEHSWHAALMALVLPQACAFPVDAARAAQMLLVHDVPEIVCGDTFLYDSGRSDALQREAQALGRLLGAVPPVQQQSLAALWDEFSAGETPDARYANAIDRLLPLLLNLANDGDVWRAQGVRREQVFAVNGFIAAVFPDLWLLLSARIEACFARIEAARASLPPR